jgi:hypothetical protein
MLTVENKNVKWKNFFFEIHSKLDGIGERIIGISVSLIVALLSALK